MAKKKKEKLDKYAPPSVVRLSKQSKTLINMSKANGTYVPGLKGVFVESARDAIVGRYVMDDRWSGNRKKDAE
jgi:hypothetical protein